MDASKPLATLKEREMRKTETMSMQMLKRAYQMVSVRNRAELRDSARNNLVVYAGSYRQCVAEARRRGLWYS
jgi:hypothetical protein